MTEKRDLLVEIGTEELPPRALRQLGVAFADEFMAEIGRKNLEAAGRRWFATPRRLAVLVQALDTVQPDREVIRRGPAVTAAFDAAGQPTRAALGFAASCGVTVADLEQQETGKGKWLVFRATEQGAASVELVPHMIDAALARLPIPKRMRWGAGDAEFARPVRWVVVLFGADVVPCAPFGIGAGRLTRGHRSHHPQPLSLASALDYESALLEPGHVICDYDSRMQRIEQQVRDAAAAAGGMARIDPGLLEEVAALVEWPAAITGQFEEKFLALPDEVLIAAMQGQQKYFPVFAPDGTHLLPRFVVIANLESSDPEAVRRGNERVIRPRFADAAFFWERDRRRSLESRCAGLEHVVYQQRLGSLADKSRRVSGLAAFMAARLGADVDQARHAAQLAKCDLLTEMVGEFPELQGVIGRYYAEAEGLPRDVALALDEQYRPRFAGDALPESGCGRVLALADKLDTVLGIFAAGLPPTGDKDPFALRRGALGCLRIMVECGLDLDLEECLQAAAHEFDPALNAANAVGPVFDFIMERLRRYLLDSGTRADVFEAVLARRPSRPLDFQRRVIAVTDFSGQPEAASLAAANKRIRNILRQHAGAAAPGIREDLLHDAAEIDLVRALEQAGRTLEPLFAADDYTAILSTLAGLRGAVDAFFDQVLVMSEDTALRDNRIAILHRLHEHFLFTADVSLLQQP